MAGEKLDPTVPSSDYNDNASSLKVIRTVLAGTEAVRAAKSDYLPQYTAEEQEDYDARIKATVVHNRLEEAIAASVGKPFAEEITLEGDYDPIYDIDIDDIDLLGNSLTAFGEAFFEDAVTAGLAFLLVDMPRAEPGMTLADEIARNIRPYFIHYRAEDVLSCTISLANGRPTCIDARVLENTKVVNGFNEFTVRRVRHWMATEWVLYEEEIDEKGAAKDWKVIDRQPNALGEVAMIPYITGKRKRKSSFAVKAPFLDLAWKNVEHTQSSSDQRNILRFSRYPLLAATGIKQPRQEVDANGKPKPAPKPKIGPSTLLTAEDPQAKFYIVEAAGTATAAGEKDLEHLEAQMDALAMKPHQKGTGGEVTATSIKTAERRANSAVKNWALGLKDVLERGFVFAERYRGKTDDLKAPSVKVHTEFDDDFTDVDDETLLKMRVAGEITRKTFLNEMKRRGKLSKALDVEAEIAELEAEASANMPTDADEDDPAATPVDPAPIAAE